MRPGEIVANRFRLEALAGAGGMGAVWRALDLDSGERIALKVMLQHTSDPARFLHEARVLAHVQHRAIVRYVAHGATEDGLLYLAMEWLEGEDLATRLARGPLQTSEAIALAIRLAEALGEAHARGIVHRDVKPANVLLPRGRVEDARLIDFGIARARGWVQRHTTPGHAVGTIGYMAPEQARGGDDVGPAADVFALGCVLFESLTAKPLFTGADWVAVLAKVLVHEAARLRDVLPDAPHALDALLARMLSKEPAERPSDGAAVSRELLALASRGAVPSIVPMAPPSLSIEEMQLASVVLVGHRAGAELDRTIEAVVVEEDTARLKELAARAGARLERLADGSVLAIVEGGLLSDQAAMAARCALALHAAMPDRPAALVTARARLGRRVPLGEPIDVAAALLREPAAAGVRIDAATASLLGETFVVESGVLVAESEDVGTGERRCPCIGRERTLGELEGLFEECRGDSVARAAIVSGPPGIGKSRLLGELVSRLRKKGAFDLWVGRGDPVGAASPFAALSAATRKGLHIGAGAPRARQHEQLVASAGPQDAPFLAEMLGVPFESCADDATREQLAAARSNPHLMIARIRAAFTELVRGACARKPLVVVFEDFQWSDDPSVRLLDAALRACADQPLMVLALARPEPARTFEGLWPETIAQRLVLPPLAPRAATELARRLLPGTSDEVVVRLVQEGDGNPLLLEELARAEREERTPHSGPRTLAAMLHARLDRVAPELRLVLRAASVFGKTFWVGGTSALAGADVDATSERLGELVAADIVVPQAESKLAGQRAFAFRTDLAREATYASLTENDRALGHRLAGEWLEAAGETDALVLAAHFERGGDRERASHHYLRAARRANDACDFAGADLVASLGIACSSEGAVRGALHLIAAEAKQWRGALDEASELLERALKELPEGTDEWISAMSLLGLGEFRRGHRPESELVADRLLAIGRPARGIAASRALEFASALVLIGRVELGKRLGELAHGDDLGTQAGIEGLHAVCALMEGDLERALEAEERTVALLERAGDLRAAAMEMLNAAYFRSELGDDDRAETVALRAAELREKLGIPSQSMQILARVAARRGLVDRAMELEDETIATAMRMSDARLEGYARSRLAALLLSRDDVDGAEREARSACDLLVDAPTVRPFALATLANVLRARGDVAAALRTAEDAVAMAQQGVESGEVHIALALAEALHASGEVERARTVIARTNASIEARAERIRDPALRESFSTKIPENVRARELARAWSR